MNFTPSKAHLYKFVSLMNPKMVLDVSQNITDFNRAIVYEWHGSSNQQFAIREVGGGKVAIFSAKNNMVLIPEGNSSNDGSRLMMGLPQKTEGEFWVLEPVKHAKLGNRKGFLVRSHSGRAMDICGANCKN